MFEEEDVDFDKMSNSPWQGSSNSNSNNFPITPTVASPHPPHQTVYPYSAPILFSVDLDPIQLSSLPTPLLPSSVIIIYKLDDIVPQILPSLSSLEMGMLPRGVHSLTLQLADAVSGEPLSEELVRPFQVGEIVREIGPWYTIYPHHLYIRARVHDYVNVNVNVNDGERDGERDRAIALSMNIPPPPSSDVTRPLRKLSASACPSSYLLYRTPIHGLTNQKIDVLNAIIIANLVGRTLVLPYLFADLISSGGAGMGEVVDFGEVFDVEFLKVQLEGNSCFATMAEVELELELDERGNVKIPTLQHGNLEQLSFYTNLFNQDAFSDAKYVLLDRPSGELAQFPLNTMNLPSMSSEVRSALRFSPSIREVGSAIVGELGGVGSFVAVHLRTEIDWRKHCRLREMGHFNELKMFFDEEEVFEKLKASLANGLDLGATPTVYVATGDKNPSKALKKFTLDGKINIKTKSDFLVNDSNENSVFHIILAAIDHYVCERGAVFVVSSFSSMANEISLTRSTGSLGGSYIYNR